MEVYLFFPEKEGETEHFRVILGVKIILQKIRESRLSDLAL